MKHFTLTRMLLCMIALITAIAGCSSEIDRNFILHGDKELETWLESESEEFRLINKHCPPYAIQRTQIDTPSGMSKSYLFQRSLNSTTYPTAQVQIEFRISPEHASRDFEIFHSITTAAEPNVRYSSPITQQEFQQIFDSETITDEQLEELLEKGKRGSE